VRRIAVVSWNFTQLDAFISFPQTERNTERKNGVPNCRKCKALVNSETNSRRLSKLLTNTLAYMQMHRQCIYPVPSPRVRELGLVSVCASIRGSQHKSPNQTTSTSCPDLSRRQRLDAAVGRNSMSCPCQSLRQVPCSWLVK
jgi:hypothetical protein